MQAAVKSPLGTFLAAMYFIDPGYAAPMFNTAPGLIAVGFSCSLVLAGRFVMNKIVNVDV